MFMHKYKYFLMFFSGIVFLLLWIYFPISFDNNDDQAMYFISSGVLSGTPSPNIIHTNLIIGILLKKLFSCSGQINWYTIYLQIVQMLALLTIYFIMIYNNKINQFLSVLLLLFLILGFSTLCIVKIQYTVVALLSCAAALFCIQSELSKRIKYLLALSFILLLILIRKDCFYIFLAFNLPILFSKFTKKEMDKPYLLLLVMSFFLFGGLKYINDNNREYKTDETYKYFKVLDDVIDKPVKYTTADLELFHFTQDDMILLTARYPGSSSYCSGNDIIRLSKKIKSKRTTTALITEIKKFIADERYMILVYVLSIFAVLLYSRKSYSKMFLNGFVCLGLLLYLAGTMRIPHRVTFPLLIYVSIINLYLFISEGHENRNKTPILLMFLLLGIYKFYCTSKLIDLHKQYHANFTACQNEINVHADDLFISLHDGLPVEYMNALQAPLNLFPENNLIIAGWNVWAPDFPNILKLHGLKNITSDLRNKRDVFFLTNSETYQKAFVNVMKQRYNLICHFEKVQKGFTLLHPQRLVFDN